MPLPSEHMPVRVLQPTGDDLFIGEIECMLEVKETGDETRPQNRTTWGGLCGTSEIVKLCRAKRKKMMLLCHIIAG
jgi:hypothetical protein